jgi:hypothetical protein
LRRQPVEPARNVIRVEPTVVFERLALSERRIELRVTQRTTPLDG